MRMKSEPPVFLKMRSILLFVLCLSPLAAQDSKITLRLFALKEADYPVMFALKGKKPVELPVSSVQPAPSVVVDYLSPLPIYTGELTENGQPADTAPSLVRLPKGKAFLLLTWLQDGKPRFLAIPDDFSKASHKDWIAINSGPRDIALKIGGKSKPLHFKPGSHESFQINLPADSGAAVTAAFLNGKSWKPFYSTYWPIFEKRRGLVIFFDDERGKPRLRLILEDLLPKPEPR
mgnify:CR=1 FL=1